MKIQWICPSMQKKVERMTHLEALSQALLVEAENNPDIYFIYIDGVESFLKTDGFIKSFPDRVINVGIAEANAVSIASGLAMSGKIVFVIGLAMYLTGRAFEQVRIDCAYNNANVKLVGVLSGLGGGTGGYSHWPIEDIALMRGLPHMAVVNPANPQETAALVESSLKRQGPVYFRLESAWSGSSVVKQGEPGYPVELGQLSEVMPGSDFAFLATGSMLGYAYGLAKRYKSQGINPALFSAHTLKPFAKEIVLSLLKKGLPIVTLEEHARGGLGSIVSEIIAESGIAAKFLPVYIEERVVSTSLGGGRSCVKKLWDCNRFHSVSTGLLEMLSGVQYGYAAHYEDALLS